MNIRCGACRHWESFELMHASQLRGTLKQRGLCARIGQPHEGDAEDNGLAELTDLSGCAGLRTDAEFSCVLFEVK
jgi:hypothetical protein